MIEVSPFRRACGNLGHRTLGHPHLVLVGFSVRSLANACELAGHSLVASDHFSDQDLAEIAIDSFRLRQWPPAQESIQEFRQWLRTTSNGAPTLLAGGTEHHPSLIRALSSSSEILGPNADQLATLRTLDFWRDAATQSEIGCPATSTQRTTQKHYKNRPDREAEKPNLRKSLSSSGGIAIQRSNSAVPADSLTDKDIFYQDFIEGRSIGATCILSAAKSEFWGATESWTKHEWDGPSEFCYRGSWGPIELKPSQVRQLERIATFVQQQTGLLGWLQMDFIEDSDSRLWLLEMNPRWTAGMEVLADVGRNPLPMHLKAFDYCTPTRYKETLPDHRMTKTCAAKAMFTHQLIYNLVRP